MKLNYMFASLFGSSYNLRNDGTDFDATFTAG